MSTTYPGPEPVGRLLSVVFESADTERASRFWQAVLGWQPHHGDADWSTIADPGAPSRRISFQRVDEPVVPTWPGRDRPQQAHLDILVDDLDRAGGLVLRLGARELTGEPVVHEEESFRVFADPDGHPFCLIVQDRPDL